MSTPQYLRKIKLTIGDHAEALDLSELRIRFAVRRGDFSTPNSADIRVYNVSDNTASKAQKEFTRVRLEAGYDGNYGVIFDGTIIQVRRGRESQTDTYLDITAADGDSAYNFSVVNCALAAGATLDDQLNVCLQAMAPHGVTLGYKPELSKQKLPRGKVMSGMVRDYLDSITRAAAAKWSIQDGRLYIIPLSNYVPGEALPINSASGMVGLPEQTQNGISLKMLLNPSVKIGRLIELNNSSIQQYRYSLALRAGAENERIALQNKLNADGLYYVMVANHSGDTRGNDWYTDVICLAVDATVAQEFLPSSTAASASDLKPIKPFG